MGDHKLSEERMHEIADLAEGIEVAASEGLEPLSHAAAYEIIATIAPAIEAAAMERERRSARRIAEKLEGISAELINTPGPPAKLRALSGGLDELVEQLRSGEPHSDEEWEQLEQERDACGAELSAAREWVDGEPERIAQARREGEEQGRGRLK